MCDCVEQNSTGSKRDMQMLAAFLELTTQLHAIMILLVMKVDIQLVRRKTYLKEILRDIGVYNVKGTHKNTWELRPEYRHYQGEEKSD
ncbi:General transcription factor IIF subunit 2 [Acipenser ruthenus]|uniref:General transcription factor IIF subunit 2 n=1 Tax=Acipenser ruthenus TaxID=7906 RepID=A0A662YY28_ACIRT|nr:General transcription factor IIF subunit 2 [Acipenser ruthenus]